MELVQTQNDMVYIHNQLLAEFNKMYSKDVSMTKTEIKSFVNKFCELVNSNSKYFNSLIRREAKVFKAMKCTLIPKIKMEVVLNDIETDDKKRMVNDLWNNIFMLYLLGEAERTEPNKLQMAKIAMALDIANGKLNMTDQNESSGLPSLLSSLETSGNEDLNKLIGNLKDLNINELENMVGSLGISNDQINSIKNSVMSGINLDDDTVKKLMSDLTKPPTENSSKFVKNILSDIKTKFNLSEHNGEVDSKEFVDKLFDVGNVIGDSYSKKLGSGELEVSDIIGALTSMATNPDMNTINEFTDTLKLNKINMKEVVTELKNRMNGKIPPELMSIIENIDPSNINNLNIGDLIGGMMSGQEKTIEVLTEEQKKELEDFYSNITI
jgi:hypothetical protein